MRTNDTFPIPSVEEAAQTRDDDSIAPDILIMAHGALNRYKPHPNHLWAFKKIRL